MSNVIRIPGLIDIHVHLRDPGETHKEDFRTGTMAALAGGITTVFDMPNNKTPIFTKIALDEKRRIAREKALCEVGFYFGSNGHNVDELPAILDDVVGLKLYLNETTGNNIISDPELVKRVFEHWPAYKPIVVHAEGDTIDIVLRLVEEFGNRVHVTHINSKPLMEKVLAAKKINLPITCDVTPHHLFLTEEDQSRLGSLMQVKPTILTKEDQDFLWKHLGDIDCVGTDHAPHTLEEKQSENPPSGMPGLETMLPLLLNAVHEGKLKIEDIIRLTNDGPKQIFGWKQDEDTYVELDMDEEYTIENTKLKTKCGWSPFDGKIMKGKIKKVFFHGKSVSL
jgi:dihydroorotase-like cyclic amidohydrolase